MGSRGYGRRQESRLARHIGNANKVQDLVSDQHSGIRSTKEDTLTPCLGSVLCPRGDAYRSGTRVSDTHSRQSQVPCAEEAIKADSIVALELTLGANAFRAC